MKDQNRMIINGYTVVSINPPSKEGWKKMISNINNMFEKKYGKIKDDQS